jgi:hypothetical protein
LPARSWTAGEIFWFGLAMNFFVTGHYGAGSFSYVNELFPAQIPGSVQASFAVFVGFTFSVAPTIPPLIAQNQISDQSPSGVAAGLARERVGLPTTSPA